MDGSGHGADARRSAGCGRAAIDADLAALRDALGPATRAPLPKAPGAGHHRVEPPEATLARLLPRLADFGITRVSRITGFDRAGIEVFTVVRPNARALSVANGKGLTRIAAKVSGIMEAIERWHGERPLLPLRFGDAGDVAALGAAPCLDLPLTRPLAGAEPSRSSGRRPSTSPPAPRRSCPSTPSTPAGSRAARPRPSSPRPTASPRARTRSRRRCTGSANSSSTTPPRSSRALPPEARAARRIDPAAVADPEAAALLDRLAGAGFAVALWETTSDVGIPAFACALTDTLSPRTPPGFGAGCHPDAGTAAGRAITEAAQTRLIAMTGTRDDLAPALFAGAVGLRFRWALRETAGPAPRPWPTATASDDLRADLAAAVAAVTRAGAGPVLAVDLSREPGLAVIRILVPGLEAASAGDGVLPGRRAARAAEHMR